MFIFKNERSQRSQPSPQKKVYSSDALKIKNNAHGDTIMQAMKTSLFMDKFCALFLNTVLLAAIPAAALATILQAF